MYVYWAIQLNRGFDGLVKFFHLVSQILCFFKFFLFYYFQYYLLLVYKNRYDTTTLSDFKSLLDSACIRL